MAIVLASAADRSHDGVCFHCQQAAEKYLKALLQEGGLAIPRTHALEDLRNLLLTRHPSLHVFRRGLVYLTKFAVEVRYPGKSTTKRQAEAALRWANRVRLTTWSLLGVAPPSLKRKK